MLTKVSMNIVNEGNDEPAWIVLLGPSKTSILQIPLMFLFSLVLGQNKQVRPSKHQ